MMESFGILLVDDAPGYRAIVAALLAPRGGRVEGADSVASALKAVRSQRWDLILLDIKLGQGDGYDALGHIRTAADWTRTVPILAFTDEHFAGGERHYIDAGFNGWLPKPFQAAEMIVTLQRWLGAERIGPTIRPPESKLATLIGAEAATGMVERFYASVAEGVGEIDAGGDVQAIGHRIGGLAGTLGFPVLSAAWLALEEEGREVWPTVRMLALEAIAQHHAAKSQPAGGANGA
jgi:CheY-like chemotaxis protein